MQSREYREYLALAPGNRVHYVDLLGVPYRKDGRDKSGMDCSGVCAEVLRRLGHDVPEAAWSLRWDPVGGELVTPDCWERVGSGYMDATQVGDILASDPGGMGLASHVSIVTAPRYCTVVSAHEEVGVYVSKSYATRNVVGAYRFSG